MSKLAQQLQASLDYEVRELTHADDDQIYALQKQHQTYFDLFLDHKLTKREAISDLDEIATQAAFSQKHYLGFFKGKDLLATLDLTLDYPLPQLVWIGQYFTDEQVSEHKRTDLLKQVLTVLKSLSAVQAQLMVLSGDLEGKQFYNGLAFEAVSEGRVQLGNQFVNVISMMRDL